MRASTLLPPAFARLQPPIEGGLRGALDDTRGLLADMIRHHMGWRDPGGGGKALRPTFCLLVCEALAGRWQPALEAAVALELVHNFSLIHDDIQDADATRRNRPTVWARFGTAQAINAGDALLALAQRVIVGTRLSPERSRAAAALAAATLQMVEGQVLDLTQEGRLDGGLRAYRTMVRLKTGALMGCAFELGAIFGGAAPRTAGRLRASGEAVGLAFQMRDDILGIWGDPAQTGKPSASDLRRRKASYPPLALQARPDAPADVLRDVYGRSRPTPAAVQRLVAALEQAGIQDAAQRRAQRYARRAAAILRDLRLKPAPRRELEELIRFVVQRTA